ncbi:hypothetical protein BN946_scf184969.g75 [Trametes cinnabarina]|uniref:Major facilitator superfamily (MFS) profile domain-containing protein n=1 Tax=Pycnoporus cinnabarinus TaxID=5643 RepID=A0A060SZP0_PYCCI|nr:hypothetical protein BN946_scf184969.g75 [Trametes cinnabarina]
MSDSNSNVRPQREDSVQDDPPADCYKPPQLVSAKVINANHLSALRMDSDEDRRLWRRIDMRLIPLVTVMYLVAFIDKTNIGNAKIQGLTAQLMLTGNQFNIVLTLNFVANCAFALPAKLRPSVWLPGITIVWGIITYHQLLALRVCLGIAEAGLSPGILYYLTLWYPRYMLQYRIGLFWGGAAFAGAFSGLLAYGISFMSGLAGLEGWSWIFAVNRKYSNEMGSHAVLALDTSSNMPEDPDFSLRYLVDALLDWQVWAGCLIELSIITPAHVSVTMPVYGISLFLPSIIDG